MQFLCVAQFLLLVPGISAGADLVKQEKCLACHAIAGEGNVKRPLDGIGSRRSREEIRQLLVDPAGMAKKEGRKPPAMPPTQLKGLELESVVDYLYSLKKES